MICSVNQPTTPDLENEQNFKNKGLKEDLKIFSEFQLGVSKFQYEVSFLNFEVSDQSFKASTLEPI